MDPIITINLIYLLGFSASDFNFVWLISKHLFNNAARLVDGWDNQEWPVIRVLASHAFMYFMLVLTSVRLIFYTVFPGSEKYCKKDRFKLIFEHILASAFGQGFLTRAFLGKQIVPDFIMAQVSHWLFLWFREEGMDKDDEYALAKKFELFSVIWVGFKILLSISVLTHACNQIACEKCKAGTGCRKKSLSTLLWLYEWLLMR